jgi:hypothetical protein
MSGVRNLPFFLGAFLPINLVGGVQGILPVANGGTGDTGTAWTVFAPTVSSEAGVITSFTSAGRFKTLGKTVFAQMAVTITNAGTGAAGLIIGLPVAAVASATNGVFAGRETSAGKMLQGLASGAAVHIFNFDNTGMIATGASASVSGVYESI